MYGNMGRTVITQLSPTTPWRHLSNFQGSMCRHKAAVGEINKDTEEVVRYMSSRVLTSEGALAGYKIKCMPRLLYKLRHSNLTKVQINGMQSKVNAMLKTKMHVPHRTANDLLYGHRAGGGLEFPHLWDETNLHKLTMLQSGLLKEGTDLQRVLTGAVCRMKDWARLSDASMQSNKMLLIEIDGAAWLSSLWKWMMRGGYKIKLPAVGKSPKSECILDKYIDYELGRNTVPTPATTRPSRLPCEG